MNNPPVAGPINILISLETICDNRAALDRLAELALLMQARLHGLYVEDEELLDIAEFPFTQEVRLHSAAEGGLERNLLEQQMRSVSRQAEALLAQVATQWGGGMAIPAGSRKNHHGTLSSSPAGRYCLDTGG